MSADAAENDAAPGAYGDEPPAIDWAVLQDPFGNEFCIVELLTPDQQAAAMASTATDDHTLRVDTGVATATPPSWITRHPSPDPQHRQLNNP